MTALALALLAAVGVGQRADASCISYLPGWVFERAEPLTPHPLGFDGPFDHYDQVQVHMEGDRLCISYDDGRCAEPVEP